MRAAPERARRRADDDEVAVVKEVAVEEVVGAVVVTVATPARNSASNCFRTPSEAAWVQSTLHALRVAGEERTARGESTER